MFDLTRFSGDLHEALPREGNLFVSPFSIGCALAMVHVGARGKTAGVTGRALDLPVDASEAGRAVREILASLAEGPGPRPADVPPEPERFRLSIANAMFARRDYDFHGEYLGRLEEVFEAMVEAIDFDDPEAAAERINGWVREKTHDMIPSIVTRRDLGPDVVCALVNAAHFLAAWRTPFEEAMTRPRPFLLEDGEEVEVPMMNVTSEMPRMRDDDLGFEAARIPYHGAHLLVVLPDSGRFRAVEESFGAGLIASVDASLAPTDVDLALPRFEVEQSADLADVLAAVGLADLFDAPDLSGMADEPAGLVISRVIHRARLRVDEKGTEAAAATAVIVALGAAPGDEMMMPVPFHVDRPFLLVIRDDRHHLPLFAGRIVDPRA